MTAATTIFNTVIEPAAKRRRQSLSFSSRKYQPVVEENPELVWTYDEDDDTLIGSNSLTDEGFCEIVAYYRIGMYPAAHIQEADYFNDMGYDQTFSEEEDAAEYANELLYDLGVDNRMSQAVRCYSSSAFQYSDESGYTDTYVLLTVGVAELWINGDCVNVWEDDIRTEAFDESKAEAEARFKQFFG